MSYSTINEHLSPETEFTEKLKDYKEIQSKSLKPTYHFRYTRNQYQEEGRKLAYGVVETLNDDGTLMVNGYSPDGNHQYPDWKIDPLNRHKRYRFYMRTNTCLGCGRQYALCLC
jgi:hypothetical protein